MHPFAKEKSRETAPIHRC